MADPEVAATAPMDSPARRRLPPLLRTAWYKINQAFRRRVAPLGVTPDQYTILRWLTEVERKGVTQRELADIMSSDANTIASLLRRMEKMGVVERQPHERDRRANRIKITPKGRRLYHKARKFAVQLQGEIMGVLEPKRLEQFLTDLELVAMTAKKVADAGRTLDERTDEPPAD